MSMREYEEAKNIVIPKEQEEMMDIICDAWEECRSLESCKDCQDRPLSTMRMMMCTALKYTRKLVEAEYTNRQAADVVEVVRCKDCKYWQDNNDGYPHQECRWSNYETPDPDDYCSYGEMRKDREYIDSEKKGGEEE